VGGVQVYITNNTLRIVGAPQNVEWALDQAARYPTDTARLLDLSPDSVPGGGGGWDGWVRMLRRYKDGRLELPTGLYYVLAGVCQQEGCGFALVDERVRPEPDIPDRPEIPLRDYQRAAVDAAIAAGRGVLDCPPRGGKTRCAAEIHRQLSLPTLWLAPTDRIVTQTAEVLEEFFGRNYVVKAVGSKEWERHAFKRIVICTAATARLLPQEFYDTRDVLIVDEFHHASGKTYKQIFQKSGHIYYRYGLTGTFFRSAEDEMAMHSLLSNVIFKITPRYLLERGYLVPTDVFFLPVESTRLMTGGGQTFQTAHGKHGIHEHDERNMMVSLVAALLAKRNRKVLVLVGTKEQGRRIARAVEPLVPRSHPNSEFRPCEFVSTDMARFKINRILDSFNQLNEVKVLIGTSLVGEGVDLPPADALVYARGEKAEVSLVQNAYRVCTAVEGKGRAVIVDFADRHNRKLLQHSLQRLRVYHANETFNVRVVANAQELVACL
jgi:superfamily II DNA or RNA helicase